MEKKICKNEKVTSLTLESAKHFIYGVICGEQATHTIENTRIFAGNILFKDDGICTKCMKQLLLKFPELKVTEIKTHENKNPVQ